MKRPAINKETGYGVNRKAMGGAVGKKELKTPFPYFGGKAKVAALVWQRLGDVDNFVEPFAGSLAVLFRRPVVRGVETVNDLDGLLTNFWRSIQLNPEETAVHADWPVSELDLHARHRWLRKVRPAITEALRADPEWHDTKAAGWWCWGLCCWIGGGWCTESAKVPNSMPYFTSHGATGGRGVNSTATLESLQIPKLTSGDGMDAVPGGSQQIPRLSEPGVGMDADSGLWEPRPIIAAPGSTGGLGVHSTGPTQERRPKLTGGAPGSGALGTGVHSNGPGKRPRIGARKRGFTGVGVNYLDRGDTTNTARPQLADAYDVGRGVNSNGDLGTCGERREWLMDWFARLQDRLRLVRICCGQWDRVCDSPSVLTRLGTTGVFLDPPYSDQAGRNMKLYAKESGSVAHEVRAWCLKWGGDPQVRVCLAGFAGEGHEELENHGWKVEAWETAGGYANQSGGKKENAKKERLWFSPHCQNGRTLFDDMEEPAGVLEG